MLKIWRIILREVRPEQVTSQGVNYKKLSLVTLESSLKEKKKQYQRSSESKITNHYESLMINKCLS